LRSLAVQALHTAQTVRAGKRAGTIASPPDHRPFSERLETRRFRNRPGALGFTDSCCFQLSNRKPRAGFEIQDFQLLFLIETSTPALINCQARGHRPCPASPITETLLPTMDGSHAAGNRISQDFENPRQAKPGFIASHFSALTCIP